MAKTENLEKQKSRIDNPDKQKSLERAIQLIEKQCGKGTMMKLNDVRRVDSNSIPSGFIGLDIALGIGGIPRGRIIEVFGPESSGKSTLALEILATVQKTGGSAVFIDAEHALDPVYASKLGVNLDNLYVTQPDTGEQALTITDELIRSQAVDIIVVDSVAALTPKAELDGDMGDSHVALQARMMSQALRKITAQVNQSGTIVIFINQLRDNVNMTYGGNKEITPGGRALKFYSSIRMEVKRIAGIKDSKTEKSIGHTCKVSIKKNKVAPPFKECILDVYYGSGFSKESSVIQEALNTGIITKSGSWLSFGDVRLGQGTDNARKFLEENPKYMEEITQLIRDRAFSNDAVIFDLFVIENAKNTEDDDKDGFDEISEEAA